MLQVLAKVNRRVANPLTILSSFSLIRSIDADFGMNAALVCGRIHFVSLGKGYGKHV